MSRQNLSKLQIKHPTLGPTASSLSVKNTSFYFSRDSKYLLVMLLMGLTDVLWSQAASSPGRVSFHISLVSEQQTRWTLIAQPHLTVKRQHFAASHSESFLVILYSLGRLNSALSLQLFHLPPETTWVSDSHLHVTL